MTPVERVARALLEHQIETGQCEPDIPWTSFVGEARVAIEATLMAIREPTEAQYDALCATNKIWSELNSYEVWTTYVDAARKDTAALCEGGE